ncbi:CehA/McbA family metallohydrolase [Dactylosporangium sp. NPDC006015]|uniref:CehA/McbA family metallohydrolase n=1 Tax=Dactylosporangium sp. NPDC006015 TaxID=3154576 RepID=UPI0033A9BD02
MAGDRHWFRGDCHVHSRRSHGGELTPEEIVGAARAAGLDFIAVTEHNLDAARDPWSRLAGDGLLVIPGQEVVTETGHWLALGLAPGHVADWRYGVRDDLIDRPVAEVHRAGGLCVVAHPHAPYPAGTFMYPFDGFDAVEVWNGQWSSDLPWNADNEAALAEWGRGLAIGVHRRRWTPAIGNSDVHLAGQIGTPQTVVHAADLTQHAVLAALRAGRCWIAGSAAIQLTLVATAGPSEAGIGEHLPAAGGEPVTVEVHVSGVPSGTVSLHTDRGRSHQEALPPAGAGTATWSTTDRPTFVRVEVRHPTGHMAALTNPVILT